MDHTIPNYNRLIKFTIYLTVNQTSLGVEDTCLERTYLARALNDRPVARELNFTPHMA